MKTLFEALGLALLLSLTMGCYALNSASTKATYEYDPATKVIKVTYESNKEQVGLDAKFGDVHVKVDKSGSSEAIAAGSLANQLELIKLLQSAVAGAQKAAPVPGVPVPVK